MNLENALLTFIEESRELLATMEDALLKLESSPDDAEIINAAFRAIHTIKGSAGLFGLDHIVHFTHTAESVLESVRSGEQTLDGELAALLLVTRDHVANLIEWLASGHAEPDANLDERGEELLRSLRRRMKNAATPGADEREAVPADKAVPEGGRLIESDTWHISIRFGRDLFRNGFDPLSIVRYLGTLGRLVHVETIVDAMPDAGTMDPESCYLGFEIRLAAQTDKAGLEQAFEFYRDDCALAILPPNSHIVDFIRHIDTLPEDSTRLGEILVACGALTATELAEGLRLQQQACGAGCTETGNSPAPFARPLGEILTEQGMVQPEVVGAALEKQQKARENKVRESRAIRVDAAKLDKLINLVGELVIAGAGAQLLARRGSDGGLVEATSLIARLVEEVRDGALCLRMVQVGETFSRFNRVVRDVSKDLGKDIDLVITGAETELDKSVVEKIGDPLMHLVRNAMDHGIEPEAVRVAAGKPAKGTLRLNAYHDSGSIVIEVIDDGGGLDKERILRKAMASGVVASGVALSDRDIYQLIFEPGLSTAEQVSNLSGRGVGMDVVKKNIEQLGGTVALHSEPGTGTTVHIRLPLTLAIINGFLVSVADTTYVVPLDMVLECIELTATDRQLPQQSYINLRGEVLPFVRLREFFGHDGEGARRENVVVVKWGGLKAGIVVDELLGEFQTVIKPMGRLFTHLRGIGGSTILGTGEVALILDMPALIQRVAGNEFPTPATPAKVALAV